MSEKKLVTYFFRFPELGREWLVRDTERNMVATIAFINALIGYSNFEFSMSSSKEMAIDCRLLMDHLFGIDEL